MADVRSATVDQQHQHGAEQQVSTQQDRTDATLTIDLEPQIDTREYRYFKAGPFIQGGDNRFDPSLCNMMESRREDEDDVVVEDGELATRYSSDVSPYGVWGRGNMRDWTVTRAQLCRRVKMRGP